MAFALDNFVDASETRRKIGLIVGDRTRRDTPRREGPDSNGSGAWSGIAAGIEHVALSLVTP